MNVPHHPLLVAFDDPATDVRRTVTAPWDGSPVATFDTASEETVDQALEIAHGLFRDRDRWLPAEARIAILRRLAEKMEARAEELALQAAREGGKPLVDSRIEVARAIDGIRNCAELLRNRHGEEVPMGINAASRDHLAVTRHEPIGVVVAISAFNHPLNLIVHQVGPAIAAGCPVIVKPAEDTPISCYDFVQMLRDCGLPPEWCQALVVHRLEVAEQLATDPRVGFLTFIGSYRVGWMLRSKLAPGTRCALEHGGAAPVIVAADADLDDALPRLAKAGFYHAGQVCVSVQRVFCERLIARQVAERIAELGNHMQVGDPTQPETDIGPLIRPREVERVHDWVQEAQALGGEILCGGKPLSGTSYAPTVILDPPREARVSQQEVFGPVICVYGYDDLDEALERANALPFAFQSAVFTRNIDLALRAWRRFDASAVMVNDTTAFRVDWMPFSGLRQSGLGVGGIPYSFEDMTVKKMLVIRSPEIGAH